MLLKIRFVPSHSEPCIYIQDTGKRRNIIVVYVDDLIIASSSKELGQIKRLIAKEFIVLDGGEAFLGN